jgi:MerR family transcriptional regulator/heat shock protein HspR
MMREGKQPRRKVEGYTISAVAERYGLHPQTLRLYEREGLLHPVRSGGNTRYYSDRDLERLEAILTLTRDMGVNLAGVEIILNLRDQYERMQAEMNDFLTALRAELGARVAPPEAPSAALVPRVSTLLARARSFQSGVEPSRRRARRERR